MPFKEKEWKKACYLGGEGGGAWGDGGRTAGKRQAHTMVNGICGFLLPLAWTCYWFCLAFLLTWIRCYLVLLETCWNQTLFLSSSDWVWYCTCYRWNLLNCTLALSSSSWILLPRILWDACLVAQWCVHWGPHRFALKCCFGYFVELDDNSLFFLNAVAYGGFIAYDEWTFWG